MWIVTNWGQWCIQSRNLQRQFTFTYKAKKGGFIKESMKICCKDAMGRSARKMLSSRRQKLAGYFIGWCLCWRGVYAVLIMSRLRELTCIFLSAEGLVISQVQDDCELFVLEGSKSWTMKKADLYLISFIFLLSCVPTSLNPFCY